MLGSVDFEGTMDFRSVDTARMEWRRGPRGVYASVGGGDSSKVMIQTPVARCRVRPMVSTYSSGWTIDLLFSHQDDVHVAFMEFLRAVQASAIRSGGLDGLTMSDAVYNDRSFRFTAFSDALYFNTDASQVQGPAAMDACSCLLQLQGVWTTAERWGLRWKVIQVKGAIAPSAAPAAVPAWQGGCGWKQQQQQQQECMFVLDD